MSLPIIRTAASTVMYVHINPDQDAATVFAAILPAGTTAESAAWTVENVETDLDGWDVWRLERRQVTI